MLPSLADLDLERLSPSARDTLQKIAIPKADDDLTDEQIADRLGLTRRQVAKALQDLADELQAQKSGAVLPELSQDDFDALKDSIRELGQLEPVILDSQGAVVDGRHRLRACDDLGIEPWTVDLGRDAGRTDTLAANAVRRQLTTQQKERIVTAELAFDATRSDRSVAAVVGVSHSFVARVRRGLEKAGSLEATSTRTDALGREQPATKPPVEPVQQKLEEDGLPPVRNDPLPPPDPHRLYVDENVYGLLNDVATLAARYFAAHKDEHPDEELEEALSELAEIRESVAA